LAPFTNQAQWVRIAIPAKLMFTEGWNDAMLTNDPLLTGQEQQ
tara:strand:+ start:366 stop:494 length:129 start_codon:yes stop_codon:yes gene_type:complete